MPELPHLVPQPLVLMTPGPTGQGSQITDTTENTARTSRVSLVLGLEIFKRALPGNLRQVQASESALRVIFMVLHTWFNFTKKAVTDVNLPGARERGVLHRSDRGLLCRLNVSHLLNDHPRSYNISPQMVPYIDFTQNHSTLPLDQVRPFFMVT
jgi:hypothetical protein